MADEKKFREEMHKAFDWMLDCMISYTKSADLVSDYEQGKISEFEVMWLGLRCVVEEPDECYFCSELIPNPYHEYEVDDLEISIPPALDSLDEIGFDEIRF